MSKPKKKLKDKKCRAKGCEVVFQPWSSTEKACSTKCALAIVDEAKAKKRRRENVLARQSIERPKDLIPKVQVVFNRYIRLRDAKENCISCGRSEWEITERPTGGKWDCGHYLSVGSHPELRFEPRNAFKQCKNCNGGSGQYAKKGYTVHQSYRENLIRRVGLKEVEWLESKHEPKKYTVEDLRDLRTHFNKMIREMKNGRN